MSDESSGQVAGLLVGWQKGPLGVQAAVVRMATLTPREQLTPFVVDLLRVTGRLLEVQAHERGATTATVLGDVLSDLGRGDPRGPAPDGH